MKKIISHIVGCALLVSLGMSSAFAQQTVISGEQQEACRVEVSNVISQKEKDLEGRLNGFLTSYKLSPLDMIVRSKQSISVFDDELAALCQTYESKQATNGAVGQACDNRIAPICATLAADSVEKMKDSTKQALFISTGRQRLFYMAQDINMVSKALNGQSRVLILVDELLKTVAQKINYFTDKVIR